MERRIFVPLFIAVFASTVGLSIIEPLMAIYAENLGAAGVYIGLIFSAYTVARAVFIPLAGKLSDHHGRKKFIIGGLALYTVSSFLYLIAGDVSSLMAVRLLQGVASAFVAPIAFAYVGDISPKGQEGKYMGTFTMSLFLGLAIGPLTGGVLNHFFSMNAAFIAMGMLGLTGLLITTALPEINLNREKKPTALLSILRNRGMQIVLLMRFTTGFGIAGLMVFLPLFATGIGLNTAQIGIIVTINLLATTFLQRFFGKMADRRDKVLMITAGNLMLGLMIAAVPLAKGFYSLLAVNLLMGLGGAISIPPNSALATQFGKIHGMASSLGLLQTAFSAGLTAGPLIAGLVLDAQGLSAAFLFTSAVIVLGSVLFYFLANRNKQKLALFTGNNGN